MIMYFLTLILIFGYFILFLCIFRCKIKIFIKKIFLRIVPELLVVLYLSLFFLSLINSKLILDISKNYFMGIVGHINTLFFHKFHYMTLFETIIVMFILYLLLLFFKTFRYKRYISKMKFLKYSFIYKYFREIRLLCIVIYILYFSFIFFSKEYYVYSNIHILTIFTIFNLYFILSLFISLKELEILFSSEIFKHQLNGFEFNDFIRDENYRIYDFDMLFNEKKYLFKDVKDYLNYYEKEALTVCIDGKCGCGKTTFAGVLKNELSDDYYVFEINSILINENNKISDYFNFVIEKIFKAYGIYNSKLLKNYMNLISSMLNNKITNFVSNFIDEGMRKNYFDLRDDVNFCIKKIFDSNLNKNLDKKGIIFIVDDLERVYNKINIVNMLVFSQYIMSFDYVKFIFVTNLEILNQKIESTYLNMFVHKVFKIDDTRTDDILSNYFKQVSIYEKNHQLITKKYTINWFNILSYMEFEKNIREFSIYLYNGINIEYLIFSKKWENYKTKIITILKENGLIKDDYIRFDSNIFNYELISDYYNYIYFDKGFLSDIREGVLNNIYNINKKNKIKFDIYNDELIISIWIYLERKGLVSEDMILDNEKFRIYKNLVIYRNNINKISSILTLNLEKNARNLKRQVSFFWYNMQKLKEYLESIKCSNYFSDIVEIINQKDFICFFMLICFFQISNFLEDLVEEFKVTVKNNVDIFEIYNFLDSNYENLKRCSSKGLSSFVNENAEKIDIEKYVELRGLSNSINYIFLCGYVNAYMYKKMILDNMCDESFYMIMKFISTLNNKK